MNNDKKIFIIAGEVSGDILAADLMNALLAKDSQLSFYGVGGEEMEKVPNFKSIFDINDIAVMGIVEVLKRVAILKKRIKQTVKEIIKIQPSVVITVDAPGFNERVVKLAKKKMPNIKFVHYVAPQVWAWKEKRAERLAKVFDYLLCFFPFEPPYFNKYGLKTFVVGHSATQNVVGNKNRFFENHNLTTKDVIITLLPGTRGQMIDRLMPVYADVVDNLYNEIENLKIVIPTTKALHYTIFEKTKNWKREPIIIEGKNERYDAFFASQVSLAISGTSVLELAIAEVPTVVVYKISPITYWLAKKLVKIKDVSLPNIIMKRRILPELIQDDCTPEKITAEILTLLQNKQTREEMLLNLKEFNKKIGKELVKKPSENAAKAVLEILNTRKVLQFTNSDV